MIEMSSISPSRSEKNVLRRLPIEQIKQAKLPKPKGYLGRGDRCLSTRHEDYPYEVVTSKEDIWVTWNHGRDGKVSDECYDWQQVNCPSGALLVGVEKDTLRFRFYDKAEAPLFRLFYG